MNNWQEDLLSSAVQARCEDTIFAHVEAAANALGFEHCAYGYRAPLPLSNPRIILRNNYPQGWRERYAQAGYMQCDPTVLHGRKSQAPLVWSGEVFKDTASLWEEAQAFGLRVGWAQSSLDGLGTGGMLTLARSAAPLTSKELEVHQPKMRWLTHVAHLALSRIFKDQQPEYFNPSLTDRELEVLKWSADGKSSQEIADIFAVSKHTVDFHVRNAVNKLQVANKTAAVVRAAILGYLN